MILRRLDPARSPNRTGSRWPKAHRVRFGHKAVVQVNISLTSASEGKADLKNAKNQDSKGPVSAHSGLHSINLFAGLI